MTSGHHSHMQVTMQFMLVILAMIEALLRLRDHIATCKVLWITDIILTAASDILVGMDQAIADGVDIMSLPTGFSRRIQFITRGKKAIIKK